MHQPGHIVFISTGSNVGAKAANLRKAALLISTQIGPVVQKSAMYKTAAWGMENQAAFYNQVLQISTLLSPTQTMEKLLEIELQMGRKRMEKWGPRMIDLDILFFDNEIVNEPHLVVPHPQLQNRNFVLKPLLELVPNKIHPVLNLTISKLLEICPDNLPAKALKLS